jgi:PAS domain S-box-containing protein
MYNTKAGITMIFFGSKNTTPQPTATSANLSHTYELAIHTISDGVMVIDESQNVTLANPAMLSLIGWDGADALHLNYHSVLTILGPDDKPISDDNSPVVQARKTGQTIETKELSLLTKSVGKKIPVSLIVTPSEDSVVLTVRDIEKELKDEQERAEFISTASHEMRTPVASIEGYLGLALNAETATIDERARSYITKAHEASQHLGMLFQELLDVTKLDDGAAKANLKVTDVAELAKQSYEALKPLVAEKGLDFVFKPDQARNGEKTLTPVLYAKVDPMYLTEVLNNLIENAAKYTPSGTIEVDAQPADNQVILSVKDSGIGIAPEDASHLFQKFYRVDSTDTREIGGTGLGLYISKQRIEAIGGRLWVESELGKGSKFLISVPRLTNEQAQNLINDEILMARESGPAPAPAEPVVPPPVAALAPVMASPIAPATTMPAQPVVAPAAATPQPAVPVAPVATVPVMQPQPVAPPVVAVPQPVQAQPAPAPIAQPVAVPAPQAPTPQAAVVAPVPPAEGQAAQT